MGWFGVHREKAVFPMYHKSMYTRVLAYIRRQELMHAGDRIGIAVSGGLDSVALLRLLLELRPELGVVLSVVHLNHGIRGAQADTDQEFVAALAQEHGLDFFATSVDAPAYSKSRKLSLEAAARELRYEYFHRLLTMGTVSKIATAHNLDDQAETVLLRLLRGAGTRGLAGIYPRKRVGSAGARKEAAIIVRPLLEIRRPELEQYLRTLDQDWREDASNLDLKHSRNRVRHELLPLLEREYNPRIRDLLAEAAEIARAEEDFWSGEVESLLPQVATGENALNLNLLARESLAMQRRLLRAAVAKLGLQLEFKHVEQILRLAETEESENFECDLPGGWVARRVRNELRFQKISPHQAKDGYEYRFPLPGEVQVGEIGTRLKAFLLPLPAQKSGYNREQLLDPNGLASELVVRNWRPGDRFWPAHTKSPKKVKELLQQKHIAQPEKALWPVVTSGDQLVWVRGFAPSVNFSPPGNVGETLVIEETPIE